MKEFKNDKEAQEAFHLIVNTNKSVFLTGKAGTGKTTLIKEILGQCKKNVVKVAYTGIASQHIEGTTINSLFQLQPTNKYYLEGEFPKVSYKRKKIELLKSIDLLVIDEASLIPAWVLDHISWILKGIKKSDIEFGGVQVLLVGDVFQIKPITTKEDEEYFLKRYNSCLFFDSKVFKTGYFTNLLLKNNYRQSNELYVNMLDKIRMNNISSEELNMLNSMCLSNKKVDNIYEPNSVILSNHKKDVEELNEEALKKNYEKEWHYKAIIKQQLELWDSDSRYDLILKKGMPVMFTKNNPKVGYVNGTIGVIAALDEDRILVRLKSGGATVVVRERKKEIEYKICETTKKVKKITKGSYIQFPLTLAVAITVHKSQGLTFDRVHYHNENCAFDNGQIYVALSRCKSLEGLSFEKPIEMKEIKVHQASLDFYKTMTA